MRDGDIEGGVKGAKDAVKIDFYCTYRTFHEGYSPLIAAVPVRPASRPVAKA
jgi:hypothetical protein